jgi:hypothetical protein
MQKDHLRLTREELYNLVWAKPMTQVAWDFQISHSRYFLLSDPGFMSTVASRESPLIDFKVTRRILCSLLENARVLSIESENRDFSDGN